MAGTGRGVSDEPFDRQLARLVAQAHHLFQRGDSITTSHEVIQWAISASDTLGEWTRSDAT